MIRFVRERSLAAVLIIFALIAPSCRVVRPIEPGQKVSIDPCSLVSESKIQEALGGPLAPPGLLLTLEQFREGKRTDGAYCRYEKSGAEGNGEYFEISVESETKTEVAGVGQKVTDLGRDAVIRANQRHGLNMYVLSDEGAYLYAALSIAGKDEKALVGAIKPLVKDALATVEDHFPGNYVPAPSPPPVDVCSLVPEEELFPQLVEGDGAGFKEEWTNGASGGRWGCWFMPEDTVVAHLPKNLAAYETLMARGEQVKGLGTRAYWKPPVRTPSFIWGQLFVIAKNGKAFGVDVDRFDADDQMHKTLAIDVAKRILERI